MTTRRSRSLDPTTALLVKLDAVSGRLASDATPPLEAAAQLREIAVDRTDLVAQAAGNILGRFLARPGSMRPDSLLAAAYLVLAGADQDATLTDAAWPVESGLRLRRTGLVVIDEDGLRSGAPPARPAEFGV